jgi:hypothetical protein
MEANDIPKLKFKIQNLTNDTQKLRKQIILMLGFWWEPVLDCIIILD